MGRTENETITTVPVTLESSVSLVSVETYLKADVIFEHIKTASQVVSVLLNIINIIVYSQPRMRSPTSTYLIAMSVTQCAFSVLYFLSPIASGLGALGLNTFFGLFHALIISNYFMLCLGRSMYSITCLVSIERFLAIAFPLQAKLFRVTRSPMLFISVVVILIFISHLFIAIKYSIYQVSSEIVSGNIATTQAVLSDYIPSTHENTVYIQNEEDNSREQNMSSMNAFVATFELSHLVSTAAQTRIVLYTPAPIKLISSPLKTVWTFGPSSVFRTNPAVLETWGTISAMVWVYGALLLGLLMNVLLIVSLTRHSRQRRAITTSDHGAEKDKQVRQTTRTVLTASLMFVSLSLPLVTNAVVSNVHPGYGYFSQHRYTFLFMQSFGGTCQSLSFSTDFISFLLLSSAYRSTLGSLIARTFSFFSAPLRNHSHLKQSTRRQKHLEGQMSSVNKMETSNVTKETGEE